VLKDYVGRPCGRETATCSWTRPKQRSWSPISGKTRETRSIIIGGDCAERVTDFRLVEVHTEEDLTTVLGNKAQQRLFFLRVLRKTNIDQRLLVSFHRPTIGSINCLCVCMRELQSHQHGWGNPQVPSTHSGGPTSPTRPSSSESISYPSTYLVLPYPLYLCTFLSVLPSMPALYLYSVTSDRVWLVGSYYVVCCYLL